MGSTSTIEWTDATWNPVTGCTKISPGCKHCYAETIAERFRGTKAFPNGFDVMLRPDRLDIPDRWIDPRRVFVCSMADLLHESVPDEYIRDVVSTCERNIRHTFQILTKREDRLVDFADAHGSFAPNVWIGVTVEDARYGLPRIEALKQVDCRVRFLSIEPLLADLGRIDLDGIDWVIVGGESGGKCRPMQADWVRSIRDQCIAAGCPFFFKQWGGLRPKSQGRLLDGVEHNAMPFVWQSKAQAVEDD